MFLYHEGRLPSITTCFNSDVPPNSFGGAVGVARETVVDEGTDSCPVGDVVSDLTVAGDDEGY